MRVLQVGFGNIGREVWTDYKAAFIKDTYMVVDLVKPVPEGYQWDGEPVDVAVILVDTPGESRYDGFDYTCLTQVIEEYAGLAQFLLIRSTVSLGFLDQPVYLKRQDQIGFAPEFYGATKWSSREAVTIGFNVFTDNVPEWFRSRIGGDPLLTGTPREVIVAKLAENAYLATKVTFFHELAMLCEAEGIDFDGVRRVVTADPRINNDHSYVEQLGWQSHCFDKDVPAFGLLGPEVTLVRSVIAANSTLLRARDATRKLSSRLDLE